MKPTTWPDDDLEYLRIAWHAQTPTAEIARVLERSPSAVIGKAHRMGLGRHGGAKTRGPVTLRDIKPDGCRFPVTDERPYRFCNRKQSGSGPYCAKHRQVCYQDAPAPKRLGRLAGLN